MSGVNDRQVGGDHYKSSSGIQHWDIVEQHGVGYLEGCATKYLSRHRKKGGLLDLEKARHYVEKLIDMHENGARGPRGFVPLMVCIQFAKDQGLKPEEERACILLFQWCRRSELDAALSYIIGCMAQYANAA